MDITAEQVWIVISSVVTVASLVVRVTPTPVDDGIMAVVLQVVNALALSKKDK